MERVLHNKICYLARKGSYELTILTTDQGDAPLFYKFPDTVRIIDLGINYTDSYDLSPIKRLVSIRKKRHRHLKLLTDFLTSDKTDIVVALYPSEVSFVPRIHDGSKKILEFHSNRWFRFNQGYHGWHKVIARYRTWQDYHLARQFDKMVVLTKDGAEQWGRMSNLEIIPNAVAGILPDRPYQTDSKRVIAVGRLIYEKGFDRLLEAWAQLPPEILQEWTLDLFGSGVLEDALRLQIRKSGLQDTVKINPPTQAIFEEYAKSSFLVMSSRSEGFGMVMIEALSCGIPVVSFDFRCGPREFIIDGENGLLVPNDDIPTLAQAMKTMMQNEQMRQSMSGKAKEIATQYSETAIMSRWEHLFQELIQQ